MKTYNEIQDMPSPNKKIGYHNKHVINSKIDSISYAAARMKFYLFEDQTEAYREDVDVKSILLCLTDIQSCIEEIGQQLKQNA